MLPTRSRTFLFAAAATLSPLLAAAPAGAATITAVGTDFSAEAFRGWRTPTETKLLDLDGDGVYGTTGYGLFATQPAANNGTFTEDFDSSNQILNDGPIGTTGNLSNVVSYPAGVTVANGFLTLNQALSGFYGEMDDPTGGADVATGAIRRAAGDPNGFEGQVAVITLGADTPGVGNPAAVLRLGVMLLNDPNVGKNAAVQVNSGASNPGYVTNFAGDFGPTTMFWDVTGYEAGDTIEIFLRAESDQNVASLTGLTFDAVVPEPASAALLGLSLVALLGRRRR